MKLVGSANQSVRHFIYDASGTIATGGVAQLLIPDHVARSLLYINNNSTAALVVEIGAARATCTISSGAVSGFSITNSGFGYTKPPLVRFMGGGAPQGFTGAGGPLGVSAQVGPNLGFLGSAIPAAEGWPAPPNVATGYASVSGGAVTAITLANPGSGYLYAPYVWLINSDLDPNGVATPSATVGWTIPVGANLQFNDTSCPTTAVSIFGATTGQSFTCKYMT